MTDEAVEKARAHLVHTISRTAIGKNSIGDISAELIVEKLEALFEAKGQSGARPFPANFPANMDSTQPPTGWNDSLAGAGGALPDGFTPVDSVPSRGKLPPGLNHDTHVQVIYRDGRFNKAAGTGKRVEVGEASLFNWKHAGPGTTIVNVNGKGEPRQGMIGNPDDDIIGFRYVAPPENKMALPKAVA